jgi:thiol:disulfide interchange protein DsbA
MRSLRFALLAATFAVGTAFASPTNPQNGLDYVTLAQPQPTQTTGKKVEVIEFFMYRCPHCNSLEPSFAQWVKKQGDNVVVRRVHMASGVNDPEAHLYLTLEAMGRLGDMHGKVFQAVHGQRVRLMKDEQIIDWVAKNGIDRAKFLEVWNSFGVMTKLRRLPQVIAAYKVDGVPAVVVDGKYLTSPSIVYNSVKVNNEPQLYGATLQVMDALVARAANAK